jgi:hypothetical protein
MCQRLCWVMHDTNVDRGIPPCAQVQTRNEVKRLSVPCVQKRILGSSRLAIVRNATSYFPIIICHFSHRFPWIPRVTFVLAS